MIPQIHAIALATPAETHAALAIQAMQAGKDVFVEKPMALTLEDAEQMKVRGRSNKKYPHGRTFVGVPPCST